MEEEAVNKKAEEGKKKKRTSLKELLLKRNMKQQ